MNALLLATKKNLFTVIFKNRTTMIAKNTHIKALDNAT